MEAGGVELCGPPLESVTYRKHLTHKTQKHHVQRFGHTHSTHRNIAANWDVFGTRERDLDPEFIFPQFFFPAYNPPYPCPWQMVQI